MIYLLLTVEFLVVILLIALSGHYLVLSVENIADKVGFSEMLTWMIIMAAVTSLPELATTVTAVRLETIEPGLADLIGSNLFNFTLLALLDLGQGPGFLLLSLSFSHLLAGFISIIMSSALGIFFTLYFLTAAIPLQFRFAPESFVLFAIFLSGLKMIYDFESSINNKNKVENFDIDIDEMENIVPFPGEGAAARERESSVGQYMLLLTSAAVIILSGVRLGYLSDRLVLMTGMGSTFIGAGLVAVITSLPELSASASAAGRDHPEMAAAIIMGSSMINLVLPAVVDGFYYSSMLAVDPFQNLILIFVTIIMTVLLLSGLFYRTRHSLLHIGFSPALLLILYVGTLWLLLYL